MLEGFFCGLGLVELLNLVYEVRLASFPVLSDIVDRSEKRLAVFGTWFLFLQLAESVGV